jgi:CheY-like chemotaxis protein/HPt (histidine-containing phosphotransfer) domain-containing protein
MRKNRSKEGTGLGLAITKSLVEMMDGQITVDSVYGEGSVFHISIPKVLGDQKMIQKAGGDETIIYAPDAKVLVVDDKTINLNVACGLLQIREIDADTALSGKESIEKLRESHYDLVFMDHMMPGLDGVETTQIIRVLGFDLPIIALTANAIAGAKDEFLAGGMNDLLTKPINKALLFKILKDWLPAEKIKLEPSRTQSASKGEAETNAEFWNQIGQVKDLSVSTGLDRVSGRRDIYQKSLELTIKEIAKCDKNLNKFLSAGDLENFSIEVHGMKGSLANIGAMELSAAALELETAADRADSAFCTENLAPFLDALKALGAGIAEAFGAQQSVTAGAVEIPPELLPVFENLLASFKAMDFLAIDEGMERLNAFNVDSPLLKDEIEKIKDAVVVMDYEGATETIQKLSK